MHVAFVVSSFPALSQTFVDAQIRGLTAAGFRVTVHAFGRPDNEPAHPYWRNPRSDISVRYGTFIPGTPWKRLLKALLLAPLFWRQPVMYVRTLLRRPVGSFERRFDAVYWLLPLISAARADVLLCHFGDVALRALTLRRQSQNHGRMLVVFHGADVARFVRDHGPQIYTELFQLADLCLPISERWRQRLLELGCPGDRLRVHRMGVDCDEFAFIPRVLPTTGPVRLFSVARLVEKKGLEYAIRALAMLPGELRARVEYRIAGDGPLRESLQALAAAVGVTDNMTLLGWRDRDQVLEEMASASLMIVPSVTAADGDQEGIPVSAMEAMASGLPVIATRHSGIPELVADGVNGRLVPERNARALAEAINGTLADGLAYAALARAGRETVVAHFNQAKLNAELELLLKKIAAQ